MVSAAAAGDHAGDKDTARARSRSLTDVVEEARSLGLRRVHILAWRDLDDPEAGGSELHAHRIASHWASAGIDVTMRTSRAQGHLELTERDGYKVVRRSGRYAVFPRSALEEVVQPDRRDGLVEIWNGMPFLSPLWATGPRIVFLHHVHAEMWQMTLPPRLAAIGSFIEQRLAPPLYRRTRIVTLSDSSRDEIISMLKMRPDRVSVVSPGVEDRFSPGGTRSEVPSGGGRRSARPGQAIRRAHRRSRKAACRPSLDARGDRGRGLRARTIACSAARARSRGLARDAGKADRR